MNRTFYFKLPLAQPEFHWKFTNKDLYLSGKLVLRIIRDNQVNEIVVFNKGEITEGWEALCSGHGPKDNAIYFGFQSTTKYSTTPSDKVELELIAKEDLDGIGRLQTGVLKAGTHKAEGKLKISQTENAGAFIEWPDKWLLDITSEKGYMTSERGFFINDNSTLRPLTRAEKKRICAEASWRNSSFFGNSDISFTEKIESKNEDKDHFRNIRIRKGVIKTRTDITEFTDERQEQIQFETTLISEMDSSGYFTRRIEHSKKKVFLENEDLDSELNILEFGRIDPEVAVKIGILCYLYDNNNQAEQFGTATTFTDTAEVDRFQLINLKDNSIVYALELNKMDWGLCRKIQWYNKGNNTLSKSVEYADFNRPVEFKTLADPGDSEYLLPYKTVRRYFDNDGNEEKTETLEIIDAAMVSSRKRYDYDTIRQSYETDFDIEIPDGYTIIDRRSHGSQDMSGIDQNNSKNVTFRPGIKTNVKVEVEQAETTIHSMLFSTPAFADAVGPLLNAKTVSFRSSSTIQMGETETKQPPMLCTYQAPSRMRVEMPDYDTVVIFDTQADKMVTLTLTPKDKTAMKMELTLPLSKEMNPQEFHTDYFDMRETILRAKENGTAELLPETVMDGRKVVVYRIRETHNETNSETTLWIDKKTFQPVKTQSTMTIGSCKISDEETDFEFDKEFPPDFFSMDVPEGYTLVTSPIDLAALANRLPPDENSLIEMFHLWTQYTDGRFPPDLTLGSITDLTTENMDHITNELIETSLTDQSDPNEFENNFDTLINQTGQLASGVAFVLTLPEGSDWHYAGKDALFGDAEKPIFWYRPENTSTYRVIYADLTVRDTPADQLPAITE